MSAVVFDKLDALFLFLPKLEVAIDGRRDEKTGSRMSERDEQESRGSRTWSL
jgi:hypothetical protein